MDKPDRRLVAIVCADVAGYSRLMGADEEGTFARLQRIMQSIVYPAALQHHGHIIKTMGDGFLAEFASAIKAVGFAVEVQKKCLESDDRLRFRIGVHVGDVIAKDGDVFGDGVNIAARLQEIADPGGILISRAARDHAREHFPLEEVGEKRLKNISRPIRVFRVVSGLKLAMPMAARLAKWRRPIVATVLLSIATAIGGVTALDHFRTSSVAVQDSRPSVAVLPFANLSGDPNQEYFSDGLTENILTALSRFTELFVIARNSTFAFKDRAVNIGEVGRTLGVRYVVEGSVQKSSDQVRVTAKLIETQTGKNVWVEQYDRPLNDLFALQDEITGTIAARLGSGIQKAEMAATLAKTSTDLGAYDYYLRGRSLRRTNLKEPSLEARALFEKAIELDPNYAPALAELAFSYYREVALRWEPQNRAASLAKGLAYATRALNVDPISPLAHMVMGDLLLRQHAHSEAMAWAQRAIALNPNEAEYYAGLANILSFMNRSDEAVRLMQKAFLLDPLHAPNFDMYLGRALLQTRKFEEAVPHLRNCTRRAPDFWPCHLYLAATLGHLSQGEAALSALEAVRKYSPIKSVADFLSTGDHLPGPGVEAVKEGLVRAGLPKE